MAVKARKNLNVVCHQKLVLQIIIVKCVYGMHSKRWSKSDSDLMFPSQGGNDNENNKNNVTTTKE